MSSPVERGFIVLADISGFDAYLSGVELEHAQGVVTELIELLVEQLEPPLNFATFQGDAVLAYVENAGLPHGGMLLELADTAYIAFRDRVDQIHRNTTCQCKACLAIPMLDLKFLVHYGEYLVLEHAHGAELNGIDVRLVSERLLKNQVDAADDAYVLLTQKSVDVLKLSQDGMRPNRATYEHFGEVATLQLDLRPRYQRLRALRETSVAEAEADIVIERDFDASPDLLWAWLNDPEKRSQWMRFRTWQPGVRPGGAEGFGATNHCAHGLGMIEEVVLAWHPHQHYTVRFGHRRGMKFWALQSSWLEALPGGGTRLKTLLQFDRDATSAVVLSLARESMKRLMPRDYAYMAELLRA